MLCIPVPAITAILGFFSQPFGTIHNDINSKHQPFILLIFSGCLLEGKFVPVFHKTSGHHSLSGTGGIGVCSSHTPNLDIN
jgi:hypothetical protein